MVTLSPMTITSSEFRLISLVTVCKENTQPWLHREARKCVQTWSQWRICLHNLSAQVRDFLREEGQHAGPQPVWSQPASQPAAHHSDPPTNCLVCLIPKSSGWPHVSVSKPLLKALTFPIEEQGGRWQTTGQVKASGSESSPWASSSALGRELSLHTGTMLIRN